jgi:DNA-binding PadR family transcriptional regulator
MNTKSAVMRVIYHADRKKIESKARLHTVMYIVSEEIEMDCSFEKASDPFPNIFSQDVEDAFDELETHKLVQSETSTTIGGDERVAYLLTERGVDRTEKLMTDSEVEDKIHEICEEYVNYPITNLLSDIEDSEPAHNWT